MTTIQASEREELARDLFLADTAAVSIPSGVAEKEWDEKREHNDYAYTLADSLIAAGYRKPRTVTTAEALGALPFEAVIRDAEGHVLERWGDAEHVQWSTPGCKWFVPADQIALPVTVLYEVQP